MKVFFDPKKGFNVIKRGNFILFLFFFAFLVGCGQEKQDENTGTPKIQFAHLDFDFGDIVMGEQVTHSFPFKNNGNGALKIENVISSCGCTVVNYDKKTISPGNESYIEVAFNSDGYRGLQIKEIEVYSNCDSSKTILKLWAKVTDVQN